MNQVKSVRLYGAHLLRIVDNDQVLERLEDEIFTPLSIRSLDVGLGVG